MENTESTNESQEQPISDRVLVEKLRARDPDAIDEFIRRFELLVTRYARWLHIAPDERNHWVAEVLYDAAMTLGRGTRPPPRNLNAYVAGACRLRALENRAREASHRTRILEALTDVHENQTDLREVVVTGLTSEGSLRDARGRDWEPPTLSPVLARLVSALEEGVTPDERKILEWLGDQVSYTRIAERLQVTRPAAVSRIQRLRIKLIGAALRFGSTLGRAERATFVRFLRRTGTVAEAQVEAIDCRPNDGRPKEESR